MDAAIRFSINETFRGRVWCYKASVMRDGFGIVVVQANLPGQIPVPRFIVDTMREAENEARSENKKRRVTQRVSSDIINSANTQP